MKSAPEDDASATLRAGLLFDCLPDWPIASAFHRFRGARYLHNNHDTRWSRYSECLTPMMLREIMARSASACSRQCFHADESRAARRLDEEKGQQGTSRRFGEERNAPDAAPWRRP